MDRTRDLANRRDRGWGVRVAPRPLRGFCLLVFAFLGVFFWIDAGARVWFDKEQPALRTRLMPDFEYFYKAGRSLLLHGTLDPGYDRLEDGRVEPRGTLDWYLPFVPRLMTALAWMPPWPAGLIWVTGNVAAMFATIRLIGRHMMGFPARDWPVFQLLPFIFLLAYWSTEFKLNQINNLTLLLLVGAFVAWQSGRPLISGFWLGLATLIKLTPALVLVWFLLKREFRTAAAAVLTIVLAGPVSDLVVLGPEYTASTYSGWYHNAVASGSHRGLIMGQREMDWRNQGLGAVMSRWLHDTNWATRFDNEPRAAELTAEPRFMNIVSWPLSTVAVLTVAIHALTFGLLLVFARRPARELDMERLRLEWAVFVLAMLWFMPVMRQYHVIWAMPAMSMLAACMGHHRSSRVECDGSHAGALQRRGISAWPIWLGLAAILVVVAGQFALVSKPLKAGGVTLASIVVLALPLIAFALRDRRHSVAVSSPPR